LFVLLVVVSIHCQDHLEVGASADAKHRPVDRHLLRVCGKPRGNVQAVLVAGDRIPDKELMPG
jgi:hypothetical protein